MKLLVDSVWLRRQIENEPDTEVGAGRDIRSSTDIVRVIEAARKGKPSNVSLSPSKCDALAAHPGPIAHNLDVERTGVFTLVDEGRNLFACIEMRTVGRLGYRLQASWIDGAIVELRADERSPEPRLLPLDSTWLDLNLGSRTINDDFVSRAFELQPREVDGRSEHESDD